MSSFVGQKLAHPSVGSTGSLPGQRLGDAFRTCGFHAKERDTVANNCLGERLIRCSADAAGNPLCRDVSQLNRGAGQSGPAAAVGSRQ